MEKEVAKVAVVKCNNYNLKEVQSKLEKSLDLIKFNFTSGSRVLLKPNLVSADVKKPEATITNLSIVEALCRMLKQKGCKIFIGESSFMDTDKAFEKYGFTKLVKKYGVKLIIFEQNKLAKVKDNKAEILKEFPVAKLLGEMDLIINLPKLKTHSLTKYTGAVKNLYGLIPGGFKQKLHNSAQGDKKFSKLLVDLYQNFIPGLNIMDGIVGMEGEGPTSGDAKRVGLIFASRNAIALDIVASGVIGFKPKKIFVINEAIKRGLYPKLKFELVGLKKLPAIYFKRAPEDAKKLKLLFRKEKPIVVDKKKCVKCGICARKCPVKAIKLNPYPEIDKKKCIRCFCCIEICPKNALSLKE